MNRPNLLFGLFISLLIQFLWEIIAMPWSDYFLNGEDNLIYQFQVGIVIQTFFKKNGIPEKIVWIWSSYHGLGDHNRRRWQKQWMEFRALFEHT